MLETSARLLRLLSLLQSPPRLDRRRAGRAPRGERPHRAQRRRAAAQPRLSGARAPAASVGGYRLGAGAAAAAAAARRRGGGRGRGRAAHRGRRRRSPGSRRPRCGRWPSWSRCCPSRLRRRVNALQALHRAGAAGRRRPDGRPGAADRPRRRLPRPRTAALRLPRPRRRGDAARTVEPYRLVNWGRRWYLVAWDVERDDWRTFRVDRIRPRTPTGPRFTPRDLPDDDVAAYVSGRVSAAAWRYRARVTVHAPAEVVAERINPAVGTVERARRPHLRPGHRRGHGRDPRRLPGPARRRLRRHRAAGTPRAPAPARPPYLRTITLSAPGDRTG